MYHTETSGGVRIRTQAAGYSRWRGGERGGRMDAVCLPRRLLHGEGERATACGAGAVPGPSITNRGHADAAHTDHPRGRALRKVYAPFALRRAAWGSACLSPPCVGCRAATEPVYVRFYLSPTLTTAALSTYSIRHWLAQTVLALGPGNHATAPLVVHCRITAGRTGPVQTPPHLCARQCNRHPPPRQPAT